TGPARGGEPADWNQFPRFWEGQRGLTTETRRAQRKQEERATEVVSAVGLGGKVCGSMARAEVPYRHRGRPFGIEDYHEPPRHPPSATHRPAGWSGRRFSPGRGPAGPLRSPSRPGRV